MMSFISSIGAVMNGSALLESLETEFGTNTMPKTMDGKGISWAIRVRFLTEVSLMAKVLATFISATNVEVEKAEAEEVEEAEENVEMNDMQPDVVNAGMTNKNEKYEEDHSHTEISATMNVASVFEDAGI